MTVSESHCNRAPLKFVTGMISFILNRVPLSKINSSFDKKVISFGGRRQKDDDWWFESFHSSELIFHSSSSSPSTKRDDCILLLLDDDSIHSGSEAETEAEKENYSKQVARRRRHRETIITSEGLSSNDHSADTSNGYTYSPMCVCMWGEGGGEKVLIECRSTTTIDIDNKWVLSIEKEEKFCALLFI